VKALYFRKWLRSRRNSVIAENAIYTTSENVRVLQRSLYRAAKAQKERRFGVLYDKVYQKDVLQMAWQQVRSNRGAAGVDGQTIKDIEQAGVSEFIEALSQELREKRYRPNRVKRV
jgi:RNA-directed DNA polymerase